MTKIYGILFFTLLSFTLNAQIKKNSILLGGQLSYYNEKYNVDNIADQKRVSTTIGISLGKAFKENSVFGINLSYSPTKETNIFAGSDTYTSKHNRFDLGVFFREYKKLANDFYFFGHVDASAIIAHETSSYASIPGETKLTQRGALISLTPGISYQVFKKMQLEITIPNILGMQYLVTKVDSKNPQTSNSKRNLFTFYSNLNNNTSFGWLGVGFRFLL